MKHLHVAIIEDFEECLVSNTEEELREQVTNSLVEKSITPPTDLEWSVCVLAEAEIDINIDNFGLGLISYYKVDSNLDERNFELGGEA